MEEYYVVIKEKGSREQEQVEEETRKKSKALEASYLLTTSEHKLIYSLLSLNSTFSNRSDPLIWA